MKCIIFLGIPITILLCLSSCVPTASNHTEGVSIQDGNREEVAGDYNLLASEAEDYYMQGLSSNGSTNDAPAGKQASEQEEPAAEPDVLVKEMTPGAPSLEHSPINTDHTERKENIKSKLPDKTADNVIRPLKQEIYSHVNEMPRFPGGEEQLKRWLKANLLYPSSAVDQKMQGKVTVRFVVYADGSIGEIQIKRGVNPALDKEALRVVTLMPNWIPGKLDDMPVPVWCALPIVFKLQDYNY